MKTDSPPESLTITHDVQQEQVRINFAPPPGRNIQPDGVGSDEHNGDTTAQGEGDDDRIDLSVHVKAEGNEYVTPSHVAVHEDSSDNHITIAYDTRHVTDDQTHENNAGENATYV